MIALKQSYYFRFFARLLTALLIFNWPLWELSQSYKLDMTKVKKLVEWSSKWLSPAPVHAAVPLADAGTYAPAQTNQLLSADLALDGTNSSDPDGNPLTYRWFGPFLSASGPTPAVSIPEGNYTVSLVVYNGATLSEIDTAAISIDPCFQVVARSKSGKVQLTWAPDPAAVPYNVYRSEAFNPSDFVKIGETASTYSTYLDDTVADGTTYLYVVEAFSQCEQADPGNIAAALSRFSPDFGRPDCGADPVCDGDLDGDGDVDGADLAGLAASFSRVNCSACFSSVASAHPVTTVDAGPVNHAPVIYSVPITHAISGILYNYHVRASDPESDDALTFSLSTAPADMTINTSTGLIQWTPGASAEGDYSVNVNVSDTGGLVDTQTFTVTVAGFNHPPLAVDDAYEVRTGTTLSVPAAGVVENDTDPDNDPLAADKLSDPLSGALNFNADGSFDYTPSLPALGTLGFDLKYKYGAAEAGGDRPIVTGHPVVIDIDGNGVPDIFFITDYGSKAKLVALRGDTGAVLFKRGVGGPIFSSSTTGAATGDIDLDGRPEFVVVGAEPGRSGTLLGRQLVAYEHTGDIKWVSEPLPYRYFHSTDPYHATNDGNFRDVGVVIADIDLDGTPEIIVGHGVGGVLGVTVYDNSGRKRWTSIGTRTQGTGSSNPDGLPVVADLDLDGAPEISYFNTAYSNTGEVLWVADLKFNIATSNVVANLDDDPYAEIVLWSNGIYVLEHDGSIKNHVTLPSYQNGEITIADVDNDGSPEIVVAHNKLFTVLEKDLSIQWQNSIVASNNAAATVFDFDRDGFPEVAFRDLGGVIKLWDGRDGRLKASFDTGWSYGGYRRVPIVVDVDVDGRAEMVLVGPTSTVDGGVYVYESPNDDWAPVGSIWNQWQFQVTNVNSDGSIPVYLEPHWLKPGLNAFRVNKRLPEERPTHFDRFTYKVNDGEYDSNEATVQLTVLPINSPPQILSAAGGTATATFEYLYQIIATDADPGETLTFSLISAPEGMTIDAATGLIRWTPQTDLAGIYQIDVRVEDSQGVATSRQVSIEVIPPIAVPELAGMTRAAAESALVSSDLKVGAVSLAPSSTIAPGAVMAQSPAAGVPAAFGQAVDFTVSTGPDTQPPVVSVVASPAGLIAGGSTLITVYATDNGEVVNRTLSVDGTELTLNTSGQATFTIAAPGVYTATGTATDDAGNTGQGTLTILVGVAGDTTPPEVSFTSPVDGDIVTGMADIIGTATDDNFYSYDLAMSQDGSVWTMLAQGTSPVVDGVLGNIDPSNLIDNPYQLRLRASDLNGNTAESIIGIGIVSENLKIGQFTIAFTDLAVPVSGIPISIIRTYDSRDKVMHDFGVGWKLSIKTTDVVEDDNMNVFITLPDGRRTAFAFTPEYLGMWGSIPVYRPQYTAISGSVTYTLTCPDCAAIEVTDYWGPWVDPITFEDFNPDTYILTALDGTQYTIDQYEGLQEMRDPNDNTLTFTADGIVHSSGKRIAFVRDGQGRITEITDPMGNAIRYSYDDRGDLVGVTDREGNTSTYAYDQNHYLVDMITPDDVTVARNEYDDSGRLIATVDADGNRAEFVHDMDARREIVTDRRGNVTVYAYDDRGNVLSKTDALGNTWAYTYDANNNKTSETDPLGNTTTYTYDALNNLLTETDPLGNTTTYTYNGLGQVLTITDPSGNTFTNEYDASGNLLSTTDSLGYQTTHTYDAAGNRLSTTDPLNKITTYTYDSPGNLISQADPLGNTTTYTYDANGNQLSKAVSRTTAAGPETLTTTFTYDGRGQLVATTDPLGYETAIEYNALGKKSATTDKNGQRTTYEYDSRGNLSRITYPDNTTETTTYDADGNRISSSDRAGRTTTYEYDELNRLIKTTFPDGATIHTAYDAAGRVISRTDARGNITIYGYDKVGRRTTITDPLGNVSEWTYDANGNQVTFTDANDHTTTYEYDDNNSLIKTIFADGTFVTTAYDALGRKIAKTDPAGITTEFSYDTLGRLEAVADALGQITSYGYDELGNRISQTDADGHTTTFEYDSLGRMTKRTLPLGMSETMTYDANGNLTSRTDFNGDTITFSHDSNNRLVSKTFPDASSVSFTYTQTGQRETVSDVRGVTSYSYDQRDRLLQVMHPDGTTISYGYDAAGNRISVTVPSDITRYTYDALNRLETVTDPEGGVTTYSYDAVGNRASVTYPSGTVTSYKYDALNRLTYLENKRSDGTLISSYTYTLGPAGNRIAVEENNGRTVDYTYDGLYRLVEEAITDPDLGNETISYEYDPVGNRLSKTDGSGTTTYTYDDNDRLLTEGSNTYTYDDNGNTMSKTDAGGKTAFTYDYENRLIAAVTPASQIDYEYDADGLRASSTVDGVATNYLVDKNRPYAQVLEERDDSGALVVNYIYGDDLISQERSGQTSYYLYDGQLSTRQLVDPTETVSDTYVFDAFGIMLDHTGSTVNSYLYTGEQYDPNILFYYLRARYYEPMIGRFLTVDPFSGFLIDPISLHKYLYARNDPVNCIDPSGKLTLVTVIVRLAVYGIMAKIVAEAIQVAATAFDNAMEAVASSTPWENYFSKHSVISISKDEFQNEFLRMVAILEKAIKSNKNFGIIASQYDSIYHRKKNNQRIYSWRGRLIKGSDLNYYFEGVVFWVGNYDEGSLTAAIYGWKSVNYQTSPSRNAIWAAKQGYEDIRKFCQMQSNDFPGVCSRKLSSYSRGFSAIPTTE